MRTRPLLLLTLPLLLAACAQPPAAPTPNPTPIPTPAPDPVDVNACTTSGTLTRIFDVQGSDVASPIVGTTVTVRGVVVGDFQAANQIGGVFLQDPRGDGNAATSDGLFVTGALPDLVVGDYVQVTGTVRETKANANDPATLTDLQVTDAATFQKCAADLKVAAVTLPLPHGNDLERYEGMLVSVQGKVTELFKLGRGGSLTVADDRLPNYTQRNLPSKEGYAAHLQEVARRTIVIDDGSTGQNPDPIRFGRDGQPLSATNTVRGGDAANVTGILSYGFDGWNNSSTYAYRVHANTAQFTGEPRPAAPTAAELGNPTLRVASMNVLNFFNGDGQGGGFPTSRGASNTAEFERQKAKIVEAIGGLDSDVVGLLEIENDFNTTTPAIKTLVDALNAKFGAGTYAYVNPGRKVGTDEIAVAMIYKPARVTPVGAPAVLDSSFDPKYVDTCSRPTIAQTFRANANGGLFTLAEAHLKSKSSPCAAVPGDTDQLDGQGASNISRRQAAEVLMNWLATNPTGIVDSDQIIMGDINAYAMEDPIRAIEAGADDASGTGDDFVNLFPNTSYSYVFDGQWGSLDHALASKSLQTQVKGAVKWHINADEPTILDYNTEFKTDGLKTSLYAPDAFRSSDHDPLVVGLTLTEDAAQTPPPTFSLSAPEFVTSGQPYAITVNDVAAGQGATVSKVEVDWGDGNGFVTITGSGSTYTATRPTNPTANFTVKVRVTDSNGKSSVRSQAVTVNQPATAGVVISEFRFRGPSGGNDEFFELFNNTDQPIDISGWKIQATSSSATTFGDRVTIDANVVLAPKTFYLLANGAASGGYSLTATATPNKTYSTGVSDNRAIQLTNSAGGVVDLVGFSVSTTFEGNGLATGPTSGVTTQISWKRKVAGNALVDTNDNAADFEFTTDGANPQNQSSTFNGQN